MSLNVTITGEEWLRSYENLAKLRKKRLTEAKYYAIIAPLLKTKQSFHSHPGTIE